MYISVGDRPWLMHPPAPETVYLMYIIWRYSCFAYPCLYLNYEYMSVIDTKCYWFQLTSPVRLPRRIDRIVLPKFSPYESLSYHASFVHTQRFSVSVICWIRVLKSGLRNLVPLTSLNAWFCVPDSASRPLMSASDSEYARHHLLFVYQAGFQCTL